MDDLKKLRHLIEHWAEHNEEHARTYRQWAERAEALKNRELAEVLKRLAEETEKLGELLDKAKGL